MKNLQPLQVIERAGWTLKCPFCGYMIRYTQLTNWDGPTPFFYSDSSNDVLLRDTDIERVRQLFSKKNSPTIEEMEALWKDILSEVPLPPNGGRFTLWANVNCPSCKKQIPYNNGIRDLKVRLNDPKVVLIDGATVLNDTSSKSWNVDVKINQ